MKFLFIRLSSFGDILLTTPAIKLIKSKYPKVTIDYVVYDKFKETLNNHPDINNLFLFQKKLIISNINKLHIIKSIKLFYKFFKNLRKEKYDYIIDFHNVTDSALITLFAKGKIKIGNKRQLLSIFFKIRCKFDDSNLKSQTHASISNLLYLSESKIIENKDIPAIPKIDFYQPYNSNHIAARILKKHKLNGKKIAGISPCASYQYKSWSPENFAKIANILSDTCGFQLILFGSENQKEIINKIKKNINSQTIDIIGYPVHEAYSIIKKLTIFITNDSAPLHVAASFDIPTIGIFGPSNFYKFYPLSPKAISIYPGYPNAPLELSEIKKRKDYYKDITVEKVNAAILKLLNTSNHVCSCQKN